MPDYDNLASDLHWRCWDNEWVLFDQGPGQTHLINAISAAVLMQFEGQLLSIEQLLDRVAADMSLANTTELASAVCLAVEQLVGLGLLESASA